MNDLETTAEGDIRAEVNLLRLPFFALKNTGLWTTEHIECEGEAMDDGKVCGWHWEVRRGPGLPYPGPQAHAVHMALLEIVTEDGVPFENPVSWTWRDLCRRMGVSYNGDMIPAMQQAVSSTKGALIFSHQALKDKNSGRRISSTSAMNLYDRVVFQRETMPGGGEADANYVWFSQWYLDSLNAGYTAPLDHDLWKYLGRKSSIASRLYEYLRFATWRKPDLPIRYETLAAYLPVKPVRAISKAKERLQPAFDLLKENRIANVVWPESLETPLLIARGSRLTQNRPFSKVIQFHQSPQAPAPSEHPPDERGLLGGSACPEHEVVVAFYRQWDGTEQEPTAAELDLGRRQRVKLEHIPILIGLLRDKRHGWPACKTFMGAGKYLAEAIKEYDRRQRQQEQEEVKEAVRLIRQYVDAAERQQEQQWRAKWLAVWTDLLPENRAVIESVVDQQPMPQVARLDACLRLLVRYGVCPGPEWYTGTTWMDEQKAEWERRAWEADRELQNWLSHRLDELKNGQ